MKKYLCGAWIGLVACMVILFSTVSCLAQDAARVTEETELKQACMAAAVTAIQTEISRHEKWLAFRNQQGDSQGVKELEDSLALLRADLEKYRHMDVAAYVLPEKVVTPAWVENLAAEDTLLHIDMMTKSGPFYHLAGVTGGDYTVLQVNTRYNMTFYRVYPRSYWNMNSDYIYVAAAEK